MFPIDVFSSETSAADLLQQVSWRDGLQCPRCQPASVIKYGSYRAYQRYRCKDCDRTFNDKTSTIFAYAKIALSEWFFMIYMFLRFNTSIRQLSAELDVSYRTLRDRIERFCEALDAPNLSLSGPVEIDEVYVTAGQKGRERDLRSRSRGLSTRGSYHSDKLPVFVIVDRGPTHRYVVPAKSADESTVRLLLADRQQEPLTLYTDEFRAYDPLEDDDGFAGESVVHGAGEYVNGDVHVNTCESHGSLLRPWLWPHRGVSKDKLTKYVRAFQPRREIFRKPGTKALKHAIKEAL